MPAKKRGRKMPAKTTGIQPLGNRVLIVRLEEEQQTKGGIIVPDTAKEKPQQGKVVEVGPGRMSEDGKRIPMGIKKGNKVLFGKYSGTEVSVGDRDYLIIEEDQILAIIG